MPKCYIRGNTIKYLRLPPSLGRGRARGREEAEEGREEAEEGLEEAEEGLEEAGVETEVNHLI